jgi:CheY-like chemotaxis protein
VEPLIRILHLEDDAADAELVQETLESAGLACQINCVQTGEEFGAALRQGGIMPESRANVASWETLH